MNISSTIARNPGADRTRAVAIGLLLLAALAWGLGNVAQKTILDDLDPYMANGITCLLGALMLLPLARHEAVRAPCAVPRAGWGLLMQVALAFTMAATLMQIGYGHTTVTNAGFLVNTAAVLTPVLCWIVFRRRPPLMIWPASLCALSGVYLMGGGQVSSLSYGDLLSLAAAVAFAVWTLLVGQFALHHRRPFLMTTVQLGVCGVVCVGMGLMLHGVPSRAALGHALPEIIMLGVMSKGLAYVLMAKAQQHVDPTCAAVLVSAESVFGAGSAMLLLDEVPGPVRLLGGMFIIAAVTLAARIPAGPVAEFRHLAKAGTGARNED